MDQQQELGWVNRREYEVQIKTGVVVMVQDEVPATSCADSSLDLL